MRLQGARQRRGNAKSSTSYDHIRRQNGYRNGQEPEAPVIACHGMSGGHGPACVLAEQSADWYGKYGWVCFQFQCKQPFFIQRGSIFLIKSELFTRYSPSKGRHGNYFQFNHCRLRRSWRPLSECSRCMQLEIKCGTTPSGRPSRGSIATARRGWSNCLSSSMLAACVVDARDLNADEDRARRGRFSFHDRGGSTNLREMRPASHLAG
jgi:hypothetical protein